MAILRRCSKRYGILEIDFISIEKFENYLFLRILIKYIFAYNMSYKTLLIV